MINRNKYRDPFSRRPHDYSNPFEMRPIRPRPTPHPQRRQSDISTVTKGVVDIATIGVLGGVTVGILGAFQK